MDGIEATRRTVAPLLGQALRPGGVLLLGDHVAASGWPVRVAQRLIELVTVPLGGKHFLRRPIERLPDHGLTVERHDRFKLGIVERPAARKPPG